MTSFEWQRMFWGQESWGFYGEILIRSVIMYVVLLVLLRFLSKRALTQLSILEFGIVIILGSAAGDPTFYKDVPLFHCILVLGVIVLMQRLYTFYLRRYEVIETAMEGQPVEMVFEGVIQDGALQAARLTQEELFQLLRYNGVSQLGEVEVAYMEQNGQLSVFKFETPQFGLPIVPPWDLHTPKSASDKNQETVCMVCGSVKMTCEHESWTQAVLKGEPGIHK